MKTVFLSILCLLSYIIGLSAQESRTLLRDALFAEEAQQDYKTAVEKYKKLLASFKKERAIAVTALYRLAEIQRKQGKKKEAAALYRQLIIEFPGMEPQNRMSRDNLLALGEKIPAGAPTLLDEESREIARLKKLQVTSPDIFRDSLNLDDASSKGWLKVMAYLIEQGADVNQGQALRIAAKNGNLSVCKFLLKNGCDPNRGENSSALRAAWGNNYIHTTKLILSRIKPATLKNWTWVPGMMGKKTTLEAVQLAIQAGYPINTITKYGNTDRNMAFRVGGILHVAIQYHHIDIIDFLLKKNADVNLSSELTGITPLHIACYHGNTEIISRLLKENPNIEAISHVKNNNYFNNATPLKVAMSRGQLKASKLLIKNGAIIPDLQNYFTECCAKGKLGWIEMLFDTKTNPNPPTITDIDLSEALQNNYMNVVELLMSKGAQLKKSHLRWCPRGLRVKWMQNHRYPEFSQRKGITLSLPEAPWEIEFSDKGGKSAAMAMTLLRTEIPQHISLPPLRSSRVRLHRIFHADTVTCHLIRKGKRTLVNLSTSSLPDLESGDILELTNFTITNNKAANYFAAKRKVFSSSNNRVLGCAFSESIRRHIKFPVSLSINGEKRTIILNGGIIVHDPRTNEFPLTDLREIAIMNGMSRYSYKLSATIHRKDWPAIHINPFSKEGASFTVLPNDHIEFTAIKNPQLPTNKGLSVTVANSFFYEQIGDYPPPANIFPNSDRITKRRKTTT